MTIIPSIQKKAEAVIPSKYGKFTLSLFTTNQDNKEHLVISFGKTEGNHDVLVRIHSECFTGDLLNSLRCDCGEQFQKSMEQIATNGSGIIIYLRQEGRGVGLVGKLKAYNLQDQGIDTIDANIKLGYKADERSYDVAAAILKLMKIKSISLLTNNPKKIEDLKKYDILINKVIPIMGSINAHNAFYLLTKMKKMQHLFSENILKDILKKSSSVSNKPIVTLSYAQSLDGSIARNNPGRLALSGNESLVLTHKIRAEHDAILVGINTIIIDDPQLTVRLAHGKNPKPIILDSTLRIPINAKILSNKKRPIIFTSEKADTKKMELLTKNGIIIYTINSSQPDKINLKKMIHKLHSIGIKKLMVEGGQQIITSFLREKLVDKVIITISPIFVGGKSVLGKEVNTSGFFPKLKNITQYKLGEDLIIEGEIESGK